MFRSIQSIAYGVVVPRSRKFPFSFTSTKSAANRAITVSHRCLPAYTMDDACVYVAFGKRGKLRIRRVKNPFGKYARETSARFVLRTFHRGAPRRRHSTRTCARSFRFRPKAVVGGVHTRVFSILVERTGRERISK